MTSFKRKSQRKWARSDHFKGCRLLYETGTQRSLLRRSKNELVHLKSVVTSVDPHAFVSVSDVHDVLGEGFTLDEHKKPLNPH